MAIARFAKFVEKYFYDTDWTMVATMCGVIGLLNEPRHERVRRAQSWRDPDYATAISNFLRRVFETDEQIGLALISEIARQEELSQEAKDELAQILSIFGHEKPDATALLGDVPQTVTFISTQSNNLLHGGSKFKRPDMFESGLSGLPKEEHGQHHQERL